MPVVVHPAWCFDSGLCLQVISTSVRSRHPHAQHIGFRKRTVATPDFSQCAPSNLFPSILIGLILMSPCIMYTNNSNLNSKFHICTVEAVIESMIIYSNSYLVHRYICFVGTIIKNITNYIVMSSSPALGKSNVRGRAGPGSEKPRPRSHGWGIFDAPKRAPYTLTNAL
jgi:hypothetical protein